ncbi:hypothetical protein RQP46_008373 [Phenoliferia psychrophenolica]
MTTRLARLASATLRQSTRAYATTPKPPVSDHPYLSQLERDTPSGSRLAGDDHVGPFPLPPGGGGSSQREDRLRAAEKGWRQLRAKEKVGVVFTQTSSLFVVLVGGAVVVAVFYSFGTEVLVSSSPTRVFEDCVDRVKASEELRTLLIPPYTFHGANSSNRLHRNRRISSTHATDPSTGAELLFIKFWIEAVPLKSDEDETWWDVVKSYVGPIIWEDSSKPGSYVPRPSVPKVAPPPPEPVRQTWAGWAGEGLASVFGGIIPRRKDATGGQAKDGGSLFTKARKPALGEYASGEVFAELVKDSETGNFVYRSLYVDIPDSRASHRHRVNIPTANVGDATPGWHRYRFWAPAPSAA